MERQKSSEGVEEDQVEGASSLVWHTLLVKKKYSLDTISGSQERNLEKVGEPWRTAA